METFVYKDKKLLRCGYTTGTCAALAARAAAQGLVTGEIPKAVSVCTPSGKWIQAAVEDPVLREAPEESAFAECAVRKDAGDDYDVTDGLLIVCRAEFSGGQPAGAEFAESSGGIVFGGVPGDVFRVLVDGGEGVGRVTKKGLNQPVGEAAINEVPRRMIREAVEEILEAAGETRSVKITVSVPEGRKAAEKTFNPVLGITGGISILGTTGIVEPMSEDALVETIHAHMQVLKAEGERYLAAVPGNLGAVAFEEYIRGRSGGSSGDLGAAVPESFGKDRLVLCSNFIGKTIDLAAECGFWGLLFAGHLGKFVKLGNGIMNTHSREGDGRMDTLISCGLKAGAGTELLRKIQEANTTEAAVAIYREAGFEEPVIQILLNRIHRHLRRRAPEHMKIGLLLFSLDTGYLGETEEVRPILEELLKGGWREGL